jgi:hypothetical protein
MTAATAAPCRHAGSPPQALIDRVAGLIQSLGAESALMGRYGMTIEEFELALPAAIESMRGSASASNVDRRKFLAELLEAMVQRGLIDGVEKPKYGDDTVYRLRTRGRGDIAVIQKGCPDGAHSSSRWSVPDWATETYVWWLCSSLAQEPGVHVAKGVNRLRQRFISELPGALDGVIFHNQLCGSPNRLCPKATHAAAVGGCPTPPPCVYVMPDREASDGAWNWSGSRERAFPAILLAYFGISPAQAQDFIGHVGFRRGPSGTVRTTITSRFGPGRSTTYRS